jgi:hypothetical protein
VEDALSSARAIVLAEAANKRRCHEVAAHAKALAAQELAVADNKHHRHEAAAHATALAAKVLADERGGQELAVRAKVFAMQALAIAPSLPPRPTSYAGAVLCTQGGEPSAGCAIVSTIAYHRQPAPNCMPTHPTSPSHWMSQPSSRAQSYQRGSSLPPSTNVGGDFNANFGSTDLVGACDFYSLLGIGKGKLSYSLGDAV